MVDERKTGLMIGVGLLLENSSGDFQIELKRIFDSFGSGLHLEIDDEKHAETADNERISPCPPGHVWVHTLWQCAIPSDPLG